MGIKSIIVPLAANAVSLLTASYLLTGFKMDWDIWTVGTGALVLSLVNLVLKPILKIVSFPINILTLGVFEFVINAILLGITVYLVAGINLSEGSFKFSEFGIALPEIALSSWIYTLIAASIIISVVNWLTRKIFL